MKIAKRLPEGAADNWTERQPNKQKYNCDDCGASLWAAGKTIYCNVASELHKEVAA